MSGLKGGRGGAAASTPPAEAQIGQRAAPGATSPGSRASRSIPLNGCIPLLVASLTGLYQEPSREGREDQL